MKTISMILIAATLFFTLGCSKSDDNTNPGNGNSTTIKNENIQGTWRVSYYFDKDKDETSNYNGYNFDFLPDGTVTVSSGTQTFQGTWSLKMSDDDSNPGQRFVITLSGTEDLFKLTDDWVIIQYSTSEIWLKDDNTTHLEELRFKR